MRCCEDEKQQKGKNMSAHSWEFTVEIYKDGKPFDLSGCDGARLVDRFLEGTCADSTECSVTGNSISLDGGEYYSHNIEDAAEDIARYAKEHGFIVNGYARDLDMANPDYLVIMNNEVFYESAEEYFITQASDDILRAECKRRSWTVITNQENKEAVNG